MFTQHILSTTFLPWYQFQDHKATSYFLLVFDMYLQQISQNTFILSHILITNMKAILLIIRGLRNCNFVRLRISYGTLNMAKIRNIEQLLFWIANIDWVKERTEVTGAANAQDRTFIHEQSLMEDCLIRFLACV